MAYITNISKVGAIVTGQNAAGNAIKEAIVNDSNELHVFVAGAFNEGSLGPLGGLFQVVRIWPTTLEEKNEIVTIAAGARLANSNNIKVFQQSDINFTVENDRASVESIDSITLNWIEPITGNGRAILSLSALALAPGANIFVNAQTYFRRPLPIGYYNIEISTLGLGGLVANCYLYLPYTGEYRI